MSMQTSPEITAETIITVPQSQTWIIQDLFILASADSGTSNPQLRIWKNQQSAIGQTAPLSTYLQTLNQKARFSPLGFEGGSQIQVYYITTVANDAAAASLLAYLTLDKRQ